MQLLHDPKDLYQHVTQAFEGMRNECSIDLLRFAHSSESDVRREVALALQAKCRCGNKCHCTFESQRSPTQQKSYDAYMAMWRQKHKCRPSSKHAVFYLGDNPRERCVWGVGKLPTLRRSMGSLPALHSSKLKRPFLRRELLVAYGWRLRRRQRTASDWSRIPLRPGVAYGQLLGNSMHLAVATAVVAVMLACLQAPKHCDPSSASLAAAGA